jgi:hypothetical protein
MGYGDPLTFGPMLLGRIWLFLGRERIIWMIVVVLGWTLGSLSYSLWRAPRRLRRSASIAGAVLLSLFIAIYIRLNIRDRRETIEASSGQVGITDNFKVYDTVVWNGKQYILIYEWTQFPELMQRIDLYRFDRAVSDLNDPHVYTKNHLVDLGDDGLKDNYKEFKDGSYTARIAKKGHIDIQRKYIVIKFNQGKDQVIKIEAIPLAQALGLSVVKEV